MISSESIFTIPNRLGSKYALLEWIVCPNPECWKYSLSLTIRNYELGGPFVRADSGELVNQFQLIPNSNARVFPEYIPEAIRQDYVEACLIVNLSPRASATLARRCLQSMIRDFWKISGKNNLHEEIQAIKDKIRPELFEAILSLKSIGNIGAHGERNVDLIIEVLPGEAEQLVELIEQLIEEWYITHYNQERRLKRIAEIASEKLDAKRKKMSGSPGYS